MAYKILIGIDISSTVAGFSVFVDGVFSDIFVLKFNRSFSLEERVNEVIVYLQEKYDFFSKKFSPLIINIIIEENLYNFTYGYTNSKTICKLLSVNSMLLYALKYNLKIKDGDVLCVKKINPRHARKLAGYSEKDYINRASDRKERLRVFMHDKYSDILNKIILNINKCNVHDAIDATILALGGKDDV